MNTVEEKKIEVVEFNNRMPLRTRAEIRVIWLGYAHLDFGGRRFKYCAAKDGGFHGWYRLTSAYSDGRSFNAYLGRFNDYKSLSEIMTATDSESGYEIMTTQERSKVLAELPELLGFTTPEE